jgi:uncharacterized membrane protein SpoIIM required for sporulation
MKQQLFIEKQSPLWDNFEKLLGQMAEPPSRRNTDDLVDFPILYRRVCADYAIALGRHYSTGLVDKLHDMVLRGHAILYKRKSIWWWRVLTFFWVVFPATLRRHARVFWLATALFYLPYFVLAGFAYFDSDIVYSLMSPVEVANLEYMYDPGNPKPWRSEDRASSSHFAMFGFYIYNNIGIGFRTFATGILAGIGTVLTLLFNGAFIGAVSGHITQLGFIDSFWSFVAGHSAFELTGICISGAAGLLLGHSIVAPGRRRRLDALMAAAQEAVVLIMGAASMLLIAAFIEAYWSSSTSVAIPVKYIVAALLWLFTVLYLTLAGRSYDAD